MLRHKASEFSFKSKDYSKMANNPHLTPIDLFAAKEFNRNSFGHIRGAVSALAHCQSLAEYEMIAKNISQRPAEFGCKEGTTFAEAVRTLKPRWCQMPSELNMFASSLASGDMARLEAEYEKNLNASIKVDKDSKQSAPDIETSN